MSKNKTTLEVNQNQFGGANAILIADTTDRTEQRFIAIMADADGAEIDEITFTGGAKITTNYKLAGGQVVYGNYITQLKLASGKVLAYTAIAK